MAIMHQSYQVGSYHDSSSSHLPLVGFTFFNELRLPKGLLHAVTADRPLIPVHGSGILLPHLVVNCEGKTPAQRRRQGDVRQTQLVPASKPGSARYVFFQQIQRPLQLLQCRSLGVRIVLTEFDSPQHQLDDRLEDLPIREADPLTNHSALDRRVSEELTRRGAALGDVLGNGVGLVELGSVGALERGDLAEGEFGQVFGRPVGLAHGEVGSGDHLQAIDVASGLDLIGES